ncbi:MAG: NADH-quinone oxidoreductase subunit G [Chloroflexi bacterium OLB15]|nr:MAG: NADH-quinone oxidoreductase subunit G [Chloroflexi bacterium OLB15]
MVTAMTKLAKVIIDGHEFEFPPGMNLVDAAKHVGVIIPVFCYHPKMKPVGMCRMCLVEAGTIQKDRATGEVLLDENGNPQIRWMPKLQTACTMTASDGLVLRTTTEMVESGRNNILEFLLTSHPLDCPVCDKGGECPLQNQTMEFGPGTSRMTFEDKKHLDKNTPLGDLIVLDEERCIQCARCIRFQSEVAGDDVLAFHERGRDLQIITVSDPGFDSYFSGNTTDICPVGALTTVDFRFGARPWELNSVPSICPHCPVGCNTTANTRLDREFDGRVMIKRMMPRQNEQVNEIWMCDKGRFGHHFSRSNERLLEPMIRNGAGSLSRETWSEATAAAAKLLQEANGSVAAIAGTSLSNEDAWTLAQLLKGLGSERLGAWPPTHTGADLVAQVGIGKGSNLGSLGAGDAILVIASDLEEEAPMFRLRTKVAADRGAYLVVANARHTRMDDFASATITYETGHAADMLANIRKDNAEIAEKLASAKNLVIFAGAEGLTLAGSRALMQAAANFLIETGHTGKVNNGLVGVFRGSNMLGLHYTGFSPEATQDIIQNPPKVLILAQADVVSDDPAAAEWLSKVESVISLSLFMDVAAEQSKVVLPIQSFAERDGSFTNAERRVQRFYTAQGAMGESLPAWQALARIAEKSGQGKAKLSAAQVMNEIVANIPAYAGCKFPELAKVEPQFPLVGGDDLYYGGTAYANTGGLGVQIATAADEGGAVEAGDVKPEKAVKVSKGELLVVPTIRLYNRERVFQPSEAHMMAARIADPYVEINAEDAVKLNLKDGDVVKVDVGAGHSVNVRAHVNGAAPKGSVLLPCNLQEAASALTITSGTVTKVER